MTNSCTKERGMRKLELRKSKLVSCSVQGANDAMSDKKNYAPPDVRGDNDRATLTKTTH